VSSAAAAASLAERKKSHAKAHGKQGKVKTDWAQGEPLPGTACAVTEWDALVATPGKHISLPEQTLRRYASAKALAKYACADK